MSNYEFTDAQLRAAGIDPATEKPKRKRVPHGRWTRSNPKPDLVCRQSRQCYMEGCNNPICRQKSNEYRRRFYRSNEAAPPRVTREVLADIKAIIADSHIAHGDHCLPQDNCECMERVARLEAFFHIGEDSSDEM